MINGRSLEELEKLELDPADEVRPFTHSFGPQAICKVTANLGLCPVDFERACKHPRVRDDSDEGSRGRMIVSIETRHATALAKLAKAGLNSKVFAVKARQTVKQKVALDVADVAPRTSLQKAWAATVANGASAGRNWVTVGAMAYTDEFLTSAELERQRLSVQALDNKTTTKIASFLKLQGP